jgi:hypothetical protein
MRQMLQTLQQQEISISQILRVYGKQFKQVKGRYSDEQDGRCAMGVILSYCGWDGKLDSLSKTSAGWHAAQRALKKAGIRRVSIIDQNDSGYSFEEIADYIDSRLHKLSILDNTKIGEKIE